MEKKFKLLPPTMPNFIRFEVSTGKKQDGMKEKPLIGVGDLNEEEALEYAGLMSQTFMEHWVKKQKSKS